MNLNLPIYLSLNANRGRSVALYLFFFLATALDAFAAPLPPRAKDQLKQILLRDEFQPRKKGNNFFDLLAKKIEVIAARWLEFFADYFRSNLSEYGASIRTIENLLNFIGTIGTLMFYLIGSVGVILILFLVFRLIRKKSSSINFKSPTKRKHLEQNKTQTLSLQSLFKQSKYPELLCALRLKLRDGITLNYNLSSRFSDRVLKSQIPVNTAEKSIFTNVSDEFEMHFYALNPLNENRVREIYLSYLNSQGET